MNHGHETGAGCDVAGGLLLPLAISRGLVLVGHTGL